MQNKCEYCGKPYKERHFEVMGISKRMMVRDCDCLSKLEEERERQAEQQQRFIRIKRLFDIAELGPRFKKRTFDNWNHRPQAENCFKSFKNFADKFEKGKGILIIGEPGNGKTHLAASVVNKLINECVPCVFLNVSELLLKIEDGYKGNSQYTLTGVLESLKNADLIVLNDLGKEKYTEKRLETLFTIIDVLYNFEKSIIVTMNPEANAKMQSIPEMAAIMDRIKEMCAGGIIKNNASSYREELAKAG